MEAISKQQAVDMLCDLIGIPRMHVARGSSEPARLFKEIVDRLNLQISKSLAKPKIAEAIAASAGIPWDSFCDSRDTESGGGSTVTLVGLNRVIMAVRAHAARNAEPPEVTDALAAISELAGKVPPTHFRSSAEERQALEARAMEVATAHYVAQGWAVQDVSRSNPYVAHGTPYDLHCTQGDRLLTVEVKGTTGPGVEILLTPGEVAHTRDAYPNKSLFILAEIYLQEDSSGRVIASGGHPNVIEPWELNETALTALGFSYRVEHDV